MKKIKFLAVASAGGHAYELSKAIPESINEQLVFLTFNKNVGGIASKVNTRYLINPHTNLIFYVINFFQSVVYLALFRPRFIISTGAGIAIPVILIGWFCRRKIIFIETGARVNEKSKTGKLIYPLSHLFIVQHEDMLKHYPRAVFGNL